jgi:hypothetical protein
MNTRDRQRLTAIADVDQGAAPGHPDWCAGGHHCTADRLSNGEHASVPEVWATSVGRIIATRTAHGHGGGHLEVRLIVPLPDHEPSAQTLARHLIATAYTAVAEVTGRG